MSGQGVTVEFRLPEQRRGRANSPVEEAAAPVAVPVPRIARLLALAHKWEGMIRRGEVKDYAEIAREHGLTRARVTQICSLTMLSCSIQDYALDSKPATKAIPHGRLRVVAKLILWINQERQVAKHLPPALPVSGRSPTSGSGPGLVAGV